MTDEYDVSVGAIPGERDRVAPTPAVVFDTDAYWALRGPFVQIQEHVSKMSRAQLEGIVIDAHYNDFLSRYADYKEKETDAHGHGKRVPYIGWFWRHIRFSQRDVPIGNCHSFVGFMANNKWYHDERNLTDDEFNVMIALIDEAIVLSQAGGVITEIYSNTVAKLDELWDFFQGLRI
jgi:hypothetical protein